MACSIRSRTSLALFIFVILIGALAANTSAAKKPYIVYMGAHSHGDDPTEEDSDRATDFHHRFLASFIGSHDEAKDAMIYSYNKHINGFAANLEDEVASDIARHPDVVSVFLSRRRELHTTRSWEFMMLERNGVAGPGSIWTKAEHGEDIIVAHLDTGVWPESKSFDDEGYGPVPSRWRGSCEGSGIRCNRKLIGARYYARGFFANGGVLNKSMISARDFEGHGTHTLSTAGGNFVRANLLGLDVGTIKGGSPRARLASYKVCWTNGCHDTDMLRALDHAIWDGVDVISMSIGGWYTDYFSDTMAIGSFHAVKKGVLVACSAGNEGPLRSTVANTAPWILTVGASTIDREFETHVELRDGQRFKGKSLSNGLPKDTFYPLITGEQAKAHNQTSKDAKLCMGWALDPTKVKGKILVCRRGGSARVWKGLAAAKAGAAGMILYNDRSNGDDTEADLHLLPSAHINYEDGLKLLAYINSTSDALGYLTTPHAVLNQKHSPSVAPFSSRGPGYIVPEILKPDITAPGVNIIASWTEAAPVTLDARTGQFGIISGTSMACPHVAGAAALLKKLHPDWSPAAIKSALMTTARTRDNTMTPMLDGGNSRKATPFMYGSGHLRPNAAMDPGLVYDTCPEDYLDFLCALGYNQTVLRLYTNNGHYKCNKTTSQLYNLNYPSISLPNLSVGESVTVIRRVKNVGRVSSYSTEIRAPSGVRMSVDPTVLIFEKPGQELTYKLNVTAHVHTRGYVFGGLTWSDGERYVRSPIAIRTVKS